MDATNNTNTDTTDIVQPPPAAVAVPETAQAKPTGRLADVIATVLGGNGGRAMGATEIAKAVAAKGLWPAGKSKDLPKATWNALALEIQQKGPASRFVKVEGSKKGKYAIKN